MVIANRLSEDPSISVLVVEAGVSNQGAFDTIVPFFVTRISPGSVYDWNYTTVPQRSLNNHSLPYLRGHILGGSSSINSMAYTRGSAEDYDRLAHVTGDEGWAWNNLQRYIFRNERFSPPADHHNISGQFNPRVHSLHGRLGDSLPGFPTPLDSRVLDTTSELPEEFPFNQDMNSGHQLGIGWRLSTIRKGMRSSSATAYYDHETQRRSNLDVLLNTRVTRAIADTNLTFDKVELTSSPQGPLIQIKAHKEIILSAGSIGSPQILMLSGIGDASALSHLGIDCVLENPSVGQNLTDHPVIGQSWLVNSPDLWEAAQRNATLAEEQLKLWNETHTGPLTIPLGNQQGWLRIPDNSTIFDTFDDPSAGPNSAHYELIFVNALIGILPPTGYFMTILTAVVSPLSRGSITLNSSSIFDSPLIDPNFLDSGFDLFVMREGLLSAQRFVSAAAWDSYIISPVFNTTTEEELDLFIRDGTTSISHPVGTAAMSARNASFGVVDPDFRVKGTKGLRVVDASVFPYIPTAHTQVPVYILAERASDLIKESWGISV